MRGGGRPCRTEETGEANVPRISIASTVRPAFRDPELQRAYDRQGYVVVRTLEDDQIARLLGLWKTSVTPAHDRLQ